MTNDVKQTIDWSKPIEAVHEDGRVEAVTIVENDGGNMPWLLQLPSGGRLWSYKNGYTGTGWRIRNVTSADIAPEWGPPIPVNGKRPEWLGDGIPTMVHWSDGDMLEAKSQCIYGWDTSIHSIQVSANHPYYTRTPTIPAVLVERMVEVLRVLSELPSDSVIGQSGYASEARAIVADPGFPVEVDPDLVEARELCAGRVDGGTKSLEGDLIRAGKRDNARDVQLALAALRRGRALARGEG